MAEERRAGFTQLEGKVDVLIEMMRDHIADETHRIDAIEHKLERYFGELDAHIHKYHHEYIAEEIETKHENKEWWKKVKGSILEKLILLVLGAVLSYMATITWHDVVSKAQATQPVQENVKTNR